MLRRIFKEFPTYSNCQKFIENDVAIKFLKVTFVRYKYTYENSLTISSIAYDEAFGNNHDQKIC